MDRFHPSRACCLTGSASSHFIPVPIDVSGLAILVSDPNNVRYGFRQVIEERLSLAGLRDQFVPPRKQAAESGSQNCSSEHEHGKATNSRQFREGARPSVRNCNYRVGIKTHST